MTFSRPLLKLRNIPDFEQFRGNELVLDAVVRNLEVIGEAAKNISSDIKGNITDMEWKRLSNLRNILIHEYFGVDNEILWDIVVNKIPPLKKKISLMLKK